jgi:choline dehydrogenase-like flavoprotein
MDCQTFYDLCIVGSGPAGIILALEYTSLNPNKKVLLVEYGPKQKMACNQLDNSIQNNNKVNHHEPYECTNKGLGGTSATWGGRCVMYDEVDFIDRQIVNGGCTWDLSLYKECLSYLTQTASYFECGKPEFDLRQDKKYKNIRIADGFKEGIVTDSRLERYSMPTRFGNRYGKELEKCNNLTVLQGFEARDFIKQEKNGKVSSLIIREVNTDKLNEVKSEIFILAAGTQETTRILLRNMQLFEKVGGTPSSLGKYYQSHLSGKIASVKFNHSPKKTDYSFLRDDEGIYVRRRFQFSTKFLVENNLLNTAIWLDNPLYFDPKHRSGAMSFMYLAMLMPFLGKILAPPAIAHSITKGKAQGIPNHLWNIFKDLPGSIIKPAFIFFRRYCLKRKLPGVFLYSPKNKYALHFHCEQIPDERNSMSLGQDGETLVIDYSLTENDINSVIKVHDELDKYLRETGCGSLEYWYPRSELGEAIKNMSKDGIHQSGTTRIADSPKKGVVDKNLKVWGTENVFVCSSSVFPTSSQANPTFYLGVFAVRLANHLTSMYAKN